MTEHVHTILATPEDVDQADDTLMRLFDWAFEDRGDFSEDDWIEFFGMLIVREMTAVVTVTAYRYTQRRVNQFIDIDKQYRV